MRQLSLFLLGLAMSITSCETVVEVDLPREAPKLVANALLQADSTFYVLVTQSKSVLSQSDIQQVSGAEVTLYEEENMVSRLEAPNGSGGVYYTSYTPTAGHSYTIHIDKPGFESIHATTYLRTAIPIQSLRYDTTQYAYNYLDENGLPVTEKNFTLNEVWLTLQDPPDEDNFYEIQVFRRNTYYVGDFNEDGEFVITDTIQDMVPEYLRSNDPVVSNSDFLEEDNSYYGPYLLFTDEIFAGKSYTINFELDAYFSGGNAEEQNEYIVVLRTLNSDFYRYRQSFELQDETEGNPFAEPVPVYNNIEGGYGIFGGYSNAVKRISVDE